MIVIYAEKASLAKAIAVALKAGNRIANKKEPTIGHYEFTFNGENAVLCHGVGHLCGLADRTAYGEQYKNWDLDVFPCIPDSYQIAAKTDTKNCFDYVKDFFDKADLITAMETAGKHLEDEEARALMKAENKGLGTPATRARIINALFDNGYLTKNKKSVIPTEKGKYLIEHLPVEELKSPEMTGQWEKRLHDIAEGNEDYQAFVSAMEQKVRDWYSAVVSSADTEKYVSDEDTLCCPFCGAKVIKGKFGYFCSAKKDTGCSFSVGNEICGKAISDAQAIRLIEKGKTTLIKGFKKKDGSGEFDAYLVVDKTAKKTKFEFPTKTIILLDILSQL